MPVWTHAHFAPAARGTAGRERGPRVGKDCAQQPADASRGTPPCQEIATVNSRERVWAAITHQPVDRIPCDYWGTPEIARGLLEYFGTEDWSMVAEQFRLDGIVG